MVTKQKEQKNVQTDASNLKFVINLDNPDLKDIIDRFYSVFLEPKNKSIIKPTIRIIRNSKEQDFNVSNFNVLEPKIINDPKYNNKIIKVLIINAESNEKDKKNKKLKIDLGISFKNSVMSKENIYKSYISIEEDNKNHFKALLFTESPPNSFPI